MRKEKLEGHEGVELEMPGFVDHPHPTFTEFFEDLIMGYGLTDHEALTNQSRMNGTRRFI
ncbi:MAG: hypothetical protein ACE5E4_13305 [Candidatus Binatia bacterium]